MVTGVPLVAFAERSFPPCVVPIVAEAAPVNVGVRSTVAPYRGFVEEALIEAVAVAITSVTVEALLLLSSFEVAVIVTLPGAAGAVHAPVLAFMEPALAVHVIPLVTPPVEVVENVVEVFTVRVGVDGLIALTAIARGVTMTELSIKSPAALVARSQ